MKPPHDDPDPPAPRKPRDTLDDIDRQLDAVHELTEVDPFSEAPTRARPEGRDLVTHPLGDRELPTGAAEHRTAPWMNATPWVNPDAPVEAKSDPWFWPVFIFVVVLLGCIGIFMFQEMHKAH